MGLCSRILFYPSGLVQTYIFEAEGKKVLFASSAGLSESEIATYRNENVDYFLVPLQGNTHIQRLAAEQVMKVQPRFAIPHHHDDFFPPLSQEISVDGFRYELKQLGYHGQVVEIPLFGSIQI
jgi:L-ascorbate metabolism protein UlaG (beta-lactamase superfamily)